MKLEITIDMGNAAFAEGCGKMEGAAEARAIRRAESEQRI